MNSDSLRQLLLKNVNASDLIEEGDIMIEGGDEEDADAFFNFLEGPEGKCDLIPRDDDDDDDDEQFDSLAYTVGENYGYARYNDAEKLSTGFA